MVNYQAKLEHTELTSLVIRFYRNHVGRIFKKRFYRIQPATISEEDIAFNYSGEPLDATYNGVEYNGRSDCYSNYRKKMKKH